MKPALTERQREAVRLLKAFPGRDLYEGAAGGGRLGSGVYWLTYSAGVKYKPLTRSDVQALLDAGLIRLKWPEAPEAECYVLTAEGEAPK